MQVPPDNDLDKEVACYHPFTSKLATQLFNRVVFSFYSNITFYSCLIFLSVWLFCVWDVRQKREHWNSWNWNYMVLNDRVSIENWIWVICISSWILRQAAQCRHFPLSWVVDSSAPSLQQPVHSLLLSHSLLSVHSLVSTDPSQKMHLGQKSNKLWAFN